MTGLDPLGVPEQLLGTTHPFTFNRIDQLEDIVENHDLAAIKMEVQRSEPPLEGFLEKIRKLATEKGIVLIFDECTSGFRETFGGIHKKYRVNPDLAIFGKALGNGYAITAILGISNIMAFGERSFISSTFWTERIGPTAALKTLEVMEKEKSWEYITNMGKYLNKKWLDLAKCHGLEIELSGIPSLTNFNFKTDNSLKYKTLISQEMLKKGYLASNECYLATPHSKDVIDRYLENLDGVFKLIKKCDKDNSIDEFLDGPCSIKGFKRLN